MAEYISDGDEHLRLLKSVLRSKFPASSTAPAAVQAMRLRRAAREILCARSRAWDEEAQTYLQTLAPEHPLHEWAVEWLKGERK